MAIRRLVMYDSNALLDLCSSRVTVKGVFDKDVSKYLNYEELWLAGMKKHYLVGKDTHYMYGCFKDGLLVSCMAWRCDLPPPWDDGWVVGNLKTRPGYGLRDTGMIELWQTMFEICEGKGLRRWHMLIPESTRNGYQRVADRFFKEMDSTYSYEWSITVPPNTQPDVDWVWGTMGRIMHEKEIRVRTGTKK